MSPMYAQNEDKRLLWNYLRKNMSYIFLALLVMGTVGALASPLIITNFLPNFIPSIPLMQILCFAGVFNGGVIVGNVLLSIKKWNYVIFYNLFLTLLLV